MRSVVRGRVKFFPPFSVFCPFSSPGNESLGESLLSEAGYRFVFIVKIPCLLFLFQLAT